MLLLVVTRFTATLERLPLVLPFWWLPLLFVLLFTLTASATLTLTASATLYPYS